MNFKAILFVYFLCFVSAPIAAEDVFEITGEEDPVKQNDVFLLDKDENVKYARIAKLVLLNKITANSREFQIKLGDKVNYGNAEIKLNKCAKTEFGDTLVHVSLRESDLEDEYSQNQTLIFNGWLFTASPSLSSPSHPVYQLIAISCS